MCFRCALSEMSGEADLAHWVGIQINLRHGLDPKESIETCSAGAGSLILEMATLSRLSGDPRFEVAARKAFFAIWNRVRSQSHKEEDHDTVGS